MSIEDNETKQYDSNFQILHSFEVYVFIIFLFVLFYLFVALCLQSGFRDGWIQSRQKI